ncbi:universal stress protein [Fulvivirga sp. RKSG066]|uniref:universal stress protein n=1 Tax=Fulvivirga aurantia TaxID=2529383 RepID=UPI0012BC700A|nr:universal stress protein [Fulvivirga aurantia]MTI20035.1 universal stress protein [Fulvivirga aurantia]
MNKIICPVDFSATSLNAIEYAAEIGVKFHSHITLLHVFTEQDFNKIVEEETVGKSFKELTAMASKKLKRLADQVNENYKDVTCSSQLELGDLYGKLKDIISENHFDLLVMGTTGVSKVSGVFFGSNTQEVIREVKIPVLCVPQEASFKGFNKIVYASDFMKQDKVAIQEVISFATTFNARISVLHINLSDSDKEYNAFVEDLKSFIQYSKINFVNKKFKDDIGLGIQEYMDEENSDMLVVFRKHRSFVESIFHKSLTKTLSYSTDKPLFVLKLDYHHE